MLTFWLGLYFVIGILLAMFYHKTKKDEFRAAYIPACVVLWAPYLVLALGLLIFEYATDYFDDSK